MLRTWSRWRDIRQVERLSEVPSHWPAHTGLLQGCVRHCPRVSYSPDTSPLWMMVGNPYFTERCLDCVSCSAWPVPLLTQVALECQLAQISRLKFDPREVKAALFAEAGPLSELHPLQEWRGRGCLATWCRALDGSVTLT
eukprot:1649284-Amphidinium_carterae.2